MADDGPDDEDGFDHCDVCGGEFESSDLVDGECEDCRIEREQREDVND